MPRERSKLGDPLTERETKALRLLCKGLRYKQVAGRMNITLRTLECHAKHLRAKLGAKTPTELGVLALGNGHLMPVHYPVTQPPAYVLEPAPL
jgi:DNA-binding NarL/FixJ family response regulator